MSTPRGAALRRRARALTLSFARGHAYRSRVRARRVRCARRVRGGRGLRDGGPTVVARHPRGFAHAREERDFDRDRVRGVLRRRRLRRRVSRHARNVLRGSRRATVLLPHRREYLRRGDVLPSGRRLPLSTRERALRRWRGPTRLAVVRSLLPPHPLCLPRDVLLRVLPPPVPATATRAVLRRRDPAGTLPHPDRWLPGSAAAARIRRLEPRRGWCVSLLRPSSTTESTPDTIRADVPSDVPSDVPFGHSQPVRDTASASAVHDMKVVTEAPPRPRRRRRRFTRRFNARVHARRRRRRRWGRRWVFRR